ncbi:MAG TPA: GDSL-type esterase/lipase family protein [Planctomycetota bacterium]|nr:GDSL-type esterase/lipase family protein [Planctomycetota bacterium]
MDARTSKAAALIFGCGVAAGIVLFALPRVRSDSNVVEYRRQSTASRRAPPTGGPWRWWLPEDLVAEFFAMGPPDQPYDPYCYYRWRGGMQFVMRFREHPRGRIVLRTNGLGLRKDVEVRETRPDLRVLVTGDSHTEGACDNEESFANRLEAALAAAHPDRTVEVLNAGKGGYHFYNYRGVLERFRDLRPHVFVVAVYGGNDFEEMLSLHHFFAGTDRPVGAEAYAAELQEAVSIHAGCPAQGLIACKYFQRNPREIEEALEGALSLCSEIVDVSNERGTVPIFVYVPPPYGPTPPEIRPVLDRALPVLGLRESDLGVFDAMADRFLAGIAKRGARTLDLRAAFRAHGAPLYWLADHHINVEAHALVARELLPLVEPMLSR